MGHTVIDHERIHRTFPEGTGTLEMIMIYEGAGRPDCEGLHHRGRQKSRPEALKTGGYRLTTNAGWGERSPRAGAVLAIARPGSRGRSADPRFPFVQCRHRKAVRSADHPHQAPQIARAVIATPAMNRNLIPILLSLALGGGLGFRAARRMAPWDAFPGATHPKILPRPTCRPKPPRRTQPPRRPSPALTPPTSKPGCASSWRSPRTAMIGTARWRWPRRSPRRTWRRRPAISDRISPTQLRLALRNALVLSLRWAETDPGAVLA
jgi:hypothetical protein